MIMAIGAGALTSYKKIDEALIDALLKKEIEANNKKIVVLDDDPTGVQTVHRYIPIGRRTASVRGLKRRTICSMC